MAGTHEWQVEARLLEEGSDGFLAKGGRLRRQEPPEVVSGSSSEPEFYGTAITGMVAFSITFLDTLLMALKRRRPRSSRAPIIM